MRRILIFLLVLLTATYIFITYNRGGSEKIKLSQGSRLKQAERIGERIIYEVRLGKVKLGKAEFNHLPDALLDGKKVSFMTFETKLVKFKDLEKIYSDPNSYLPLRVERKIYNWPFHEEIREDYDQERHILRIKKYKGKKVNEIVINKKDVINNAILLPYYVRDVAELEEGYSMFARLPTQDFKIELVAKEEIEVPAGRFQAYHFVSFPEKFEIWISADSRRIPIKIIGSGGLMGYYLVMKEYSLKDKAKNDF